MKMNKFATNNMEDVDSFLGREVGGNRAIALTDPEDELITSIDEQKMSYKKILAQRFLKFLGNQRLNIEKLKNLPKEEQQRLKAEFLGK